MANVYLPDAELKHLKKLARANGYEIKRGPGSQIGEFIVRLMADFETNQKAVQGKKNDHASLSEMR